MQNMNDVKITHSEKTIDFPMNWCGYTREELELGLITKFIYQVCKNRS